MKFLILPPKPMKTAKARAKQRVRLFLEDGTELEGVVAVNVSYREEAISMEWDAATRTMKGDTRMVPEQIIITIKTPAIEIIKKAPKP